MSSTKPNTNADDGANTTPAQLTASIERDVAELNELLSKETLDDAGEASVAELLARLESADGVAKGVENKLDTLLGNLNNLLASLEDEKAAQDSSQQPPASQATDEKSTDKES
ncbi:hypothetical protein C8R45DRAFT_51868 [Mycena sanguinolenta]|nr:hypothetical protein C8R45DRAFT_51868 [Mycena sanguinolenta]